MKILTFSTLYPNAVQHRHGVFVQNRLRQLVASGQVESRVVAPVPWFPSVSRYFGQYAEFARVGPTEQRYGIDIQHPRYPVIPKIGMNVTPFLLAMASLPVLKRLLREGYAFELIDAHYFYPDGVAAALLGRWLNKPVVITGRGSDITRLPSYPIPRKLILWAAQQAAASITVCQALKDQLVQLSAEANKIHVLRNGVDAAFFQPCVSRQAERKRLGLTKPTLLSVGYLIRRKGHHLILEALARMPGFELLIAGEGEERQRLQQQATALGVAERVRFLGSMTQQRLVPVYGAVDALVLASSHEGWANVLLESMACGTPVIATPVGGTPEVVASADAGILASERSVDALVMAVGTLFEQYPDRQATRRYAEQFSWDATTEGQIELFSRILQRFA